MTVKSMTWKASKFHWVSSKRMKQMTNIRLQFEINKAVGGMLMTSLKVDPLSD